MLAPSLNNFKTYANIYAKPFYYWKENTKNNIDLQLSGHTHNGQMFSLSYSYHLQSDFAGNYGKETFKHHTKIISSGLVGRGVPIRTEGICEYVVVNIKQA